jgi:hypothetical protein
VGLGAPSNCKLEIAVQIRLFTLPIFSILFLLS